MARPRAQTGDGLKMPHTVSLKVLRLSRPSLQYQYPLPHTSSDHPAIDPRASLAYPSADPKDNFIVTPVLTLPESFQSAYVGEEFSCTVCANNELLPEDNGRSISAVRVEAEMQTPSGKTDIPLDAKGTDADVEEKPFLPGDSIQKIIRLNLNEPGQHVLAVTVTYTETQLSDGGAAGGRVRTFRKLYQFKATTLIGVKTKAGDVKVKKAGLERYALEAQLENLGDRTVTLEAVAVTPKAPFKSSSLNWDIFGTGSDPPHAPILYPGEVMQVAFLLEGQREESSTPPPPSEKPVLGQLNIQWRSAMGDRGSLSTSWLSGRKR
ncbi:hypothetical protein BLS_000702 [Venturia inaequalis]|uniref:DUF974 domain-containing protein n=1 Tax=Venturia inaequalis TaxID=5025 RepID=A0A8H3YLN3_VENIN|nr:hypothetical protein BLS_000702 [Venturia inaequalis]KAE9971031.1 hypothetical protein EG328_005910 [Venturia inaequalis]KAE9974501.1 hypothetical protein EG327_008738 [Venturia inaequalis]RDI85150.1 hypothetical protein Vi05172_g4813 [Venturia inaequalis]